MLNYIIYIVSYIYIISLVNLCFLFIILYLKNS